VHKFSRFFLLLFDIQKINCKAIKTWKKIISAIVLVAVIVPLTAYIALQVPSFQTYLGKKVVNHLSENINGNISIDKIYIAFFNKIILDNVNITEKTGDTILKSKKISLSWKPESLLGNHIKIKRIALAQGCLNLRVLEKGVSNISIAFTKLDGTADSAYNFNKKFYISIGSLLFEDFNFKMENKLYHGKLFPKSPNAINWSDFSIKNIDLSASNLLFSNGTLTAKIKNLSFEEERGFQLKTLSGNLRIGKIETVVNDESIIKNEARIDNLKIIDKYSNIVAKYYFMQYYNIDDFSNYVEKVVMGLDLDNSFLDFKTLESFAPGIEKIKLRLYLTGEATGPVCNLKTNNLKVYSATKRSFLNLSAHLSGLPNPKETMASINITDCYTYTSDVAKIIDEVTPVPFDQEYIRKLAPLEKFTFKGSLNGFFEDFVAYGEIQSKIGKVKVDFLCKKEQNDGYEVIGHINSEDFDIGKFTQNNLIGKLSCNANISAYSSKDKSESELYIESIRISKLGLNNYDYTNISASGSLKNSEFDGRIICSDPNLNFMFHGLFGLSNNNNNSLYKFNLSMGYANLVALHFDKRDVSEIQFLADADFTKTTEGNIFGDIDIKSLIGKNSTGKHNIGNIKLKSFSSNDSYTIELLSSFATAKFLGTAPIFTFATDIITLCGKSQLENLFTENNNAPSLPPNNIYSFTLNTHDSRPACEFLMPGLFIANNSNITIKVNRENSFEIGMNSELLAFNNFFIKNSALKISNTDSSITSMISSESIQYEEITAKNNKISAQVKNNTIDLRYSFENADETGNTADVRTMISFPNKKEGNFNILAHILESHFIINNRKWKINPASIYYKDKFVQINNLGIESENQSINVTGKITDNRNDSLKVKLLNFDASILNPFIKTDLNIKGIFSGEADLFALYGEAGAILDLKGESVSISDKEVGKLNILSKWDDNKKRFNLLINNKLNGQNPLNIIGYYHPRDKHINAKATLIDFTPSYFEPFLNSLVSDISGTVSGDITIDGAIDKLTVTSSNSYFKDLGVKLLFTNVPYILNGPFDLNKEGISFNNIEIKDKYEHKGTITGGVDYNYFKDIHFNTIINVDNILAINTSATDNESFYGRAFASGQIQISGPLSNLLLDINIITKENSTIHIPLVTSAKEQSTLLTFINNSPSKISPFDSLRTKIVSKKTPAELDVRVKVNVTPEAEVHLEINKSIGDVLKSKGSGLIDLKINKSKDIFDIKGNYKIEEGSYKFVFLGLASRDFVINPGGTINFTGNILQSDLDLTATYRTKASIGPLISDTTSISTRRNIDCGIEITGKLSNPKLNFTINIPDLDPTTKGRVESALNTEDKRLKQFMTLILSGSFIPDEQSGIVNNTTILYSNATEIMSNQLNNVFRQLEIPLDLGFNYQPGENGKDIFDVAVSTQLFNNRVNINGNIGNRDYVTTNNTDIVGNINVEVKLDKNGRIRLNLFSRSADQYSNYLDQTQRNGAGIVYQEEFNTFSELWRKIFWGKAKRETYENKLKENSH